MIDIYNFLKQPDYNLKYKVSHVIYSNIYNLKGKSYKKNKKKIYQIKKISWNYFAELAHTSNAAAIK